jgi:hypothetical protein
MNIYNPEYEIKYKKYKKKYLDLKRQLGRGCEYLAEDTKAYLNKLAEENFVLLKFNEIELLKKIKKTKEEIQEKINLIPKEYMNKYNFKIKNLKKLFEAEFVIHDKKKNTVSPVGHDIEKKKKNKYNFILTMKKKNKYNFILTMKKRFFSKINFNCVDFNKINNIYLRIKIEDVFNKTFLDKLNNTEKKYLFQTILKKSLMIKSLMKNQTKEEEELTKEEELQKKIEEELQKKIKEEKTEEIIKYLFENKEIIIYFYTSIFNINWFVPKLIRILESTSN